MKEKISKPKKNLKRRKALDKITDTEDQSSTINDEDNRQTSAYDYNSDEGNEIHVGAKRKRETSQNEDPHRRYKKSQQAVSSINNSEKKARNVKRIKGSRSRKASDSSDEQDFDQPVRKSLRLIVPDDGQLHVPVSAKLPLQHNNKTKRDALNLKKNKQGERNQSTHGTDNSHAEDSSTDKSSSELAAVSGEMKLLTSAESNYNGDVGSIRSSYDSDENNPGVSGRAKGNVKCPVCCKVFDKAEGQDKVNEHVNSCLDGKTETKAEIPEEGGNVHVHVPSSVSLLQDQLIAFEYQKMEIQQDGFGSEDGVFFCHLCRKDLTKMNSLRRQQHINKCCDEIEKCKEDKKTVQPTLVKSGNNQLSCPICDCQFKSRKSWNTHIKTCAQKNNIPSVQLIELVKEQDKYPQERQQKSESTEKKSETETHRRKKRKVKNLRDVDEKTQLAMALSASMQPPSQPDNDDLTLKTKRSRKKRNEVIPALILRSTEETQNVIAARAAQVVCSKNDGLEEDDISCTPALAPSSLAQRYSKVEAANNGLAELASDEKSSNKHATKNTSFDMEHISSHLDKPGDLSPTRYSDTAVMSLSVNLDMCQSFLSFLHVDEAEENTMDQALTCTEDIRSAPLWSLASLGNEISTNHNFYVPGLLPKPQQKTPKKSSSRNESKSLSSTKSTPRKSEAARENNQQSERLSSEKEHVDKALSQSEITSESQAVNLDILMALAESNDEDDDAFEKHRKSSSEHDDDMFPSSGFCLPIGPEVESVGPLFSSLSVFRQEMSDMVGNTLLSDVIITAKDNQEIPAHSFMLATRCGVLADMITTARISHDNERSDTKHVCLAFEDVEADVIRCVLQHIYCAYVDVPRHWLDQVTDLATRLKLFELEKACQISKGKLEQQIDEDDEEGQGEPQSAEELLGEIWQQETNEFETCHQKNEQNLEACDEGFNDEDIEEVRIFQTQVTQRKRGRSYDQLEGLIGLDNPYLVESHDESTLQDATSSDVYIDQFCEEANELCQGNSAATATEIVETVEEIKDTNSDQGGDGEDMFLRTVATSFKGRTEQCETEKMNCFEDSDIAIDIMEDHSHAVCDQAKRHCIEDVEVNEFDQGIADPEVLEFDKPEDENHFVKDEISAPMVVDKLDLTADGFDNTEVECGTEKKGTRSSRSVSMYKDIEDDSDDDVGAGDIAIFNESICLLSDENDDHNTSPRPTADKQWLIPDTPHATTNHDNQTTPQHATCYSDCPELPPPTDCQSVSSGSASDDTDDRDNMGEDGDAFLDKLRSKVTSKNTAKEKTKKNKNTTKQRKQVNTSVGKRAKSQKPKPNRQSTSGSCALSSGNFLSLSTSSTSRMVSQEEEADACVDLSFGNQDEDLMNGYLSTDTEPLYEHEDSDYETPGLSLSPQRMLSPNDPPFSSYLDKNNPYPTPVSPVDSVHSDDAHEQGVDRSPVHPSTSTAQSSLKDINHRVRTMQKSELHLRSESNEGYLSDNSTNKTTCAEVNEIIVSSTSGQCNTRSQQSRQNYLGKPTKDNATSISSATTSIASIDIDTDRGLFQRLKASRYGLDGREEVSDSSDEEREPNVLKDVASQAQLQGKEDTGCIMVTTERSPGSDCFYDDGGYNCDDNYGECLDGDDSFMARAAKQIEIDYLPDRECQPRQNNVCSSMTPLNSIVTTTSDENTEHPITPMQEYNNMTTPDLRREVGKFGIRQLPKKHMIVKLREIYHYEHPGVSTQAQSKQPAKDTKKCSKPAAKKRNRPASQIQENSDSSDDGSSSRYPCRSSNMASQSQSAQNKIIPREDEISRGSHSSQHSCRVGSDRMESAGSDSEARDSNDSNDEEFGEVSILIENETVTTSQQVHSDDLKVRLMAFIQDNHDIYLKVLHYQPIDVMSLHELILTDGIICPVQKLIHFLDEQCISFTTAGGRPGQKSRQKKKPRKK